MADPNNNQPSVTDTDDQGNEIPAAAKPAGITIVFKDSLGGEVSFKLKPTTKLKKAMDAYAQHANRERLTLRFLFDGERVNDGSTAEEMGIEDGDSIEVHQEQIGGSGG